MYLYGYEKNGLRDAMTKNLKALFEVLVDELDLLIYSVGMKQYHICGYPVDMKNIAESMSSIVLEYLHIDDSYVSKIHQTLENFGRNDIMALNIIAMKLEIEFFSTYQNRLRREEENVFGAPFIAKKGICYQQILVAKKGLDSTFKVYIYDDEGKLQDAMETNLTSFDDAKKFAIENLRLVRALSLDVLSSYASSNTKSKRSGTIYVVDETDMLMEKADLATELRETYVLRKNPRDSEGNFVIMPMEKPKAWYMHSGNYATTADCRFKFAYPIPIFDRTEN